MDNKIKDLQLRLLHLGYDIGQTEADGVFGAETKNGLTAFQKDFGLIADGDYGPLTQKMIEIKAIVGPNEPNIVGHLSRCYVTNYLCASETDYNNNTIIPIKDDTGKLIANVDPYFFCHLALEGTGKLNNGRVVNVTGQYITAPSIVREQLLPVAKKLFGNNYKYGGVNAEGSSYMSFRLLGPEYPWGVGVNNLPLELFKTLAADIGTGPRSEPLYKRHGGLIPVGSDVYILEFDGMLMPDGSGPHNGWFHVSDTGSAIYGSHLDVFVGTKAYMNQIKMRNVLHIWFKDSESKIPLNYTYGIK